MIQEILIPEALLVEKAEAISVAVKLCKASGNLNPNDPDYGGAYRNFLLFSNATERIPEVLSLAPLTKEAVFYNTYYWFLRFSRLYMKKHGFDAGLEQQSFHMLDTVMFEIDWSIVEALEKWATH